MSNYKRFAVGIVLCGLGLITLFGSLTVTMLTGEALWFVIGYLVSTLFLFISLIIIVSFLLGSVIDQKVEDEVDTPEEYAASLRRAEAIERRMRKSYINAHKSDPRFDEDWMEITDNLYRLVEKYGIQVVISLIKDRMG